MYINYQPGANGIVYAALVSSVRKDGKVTRGDDTIYLGRVLDKERLIFRNRKDGVFALDPESHEKVPAPADFVPSTPRKNARQAERYLDFGDVFFLKSFMEQNGIEKLIDAIGYGNSDSIWSLLCYYMLTRSSNCHCNTWWQGNVSCGYYPKANLISQRISDLLETIGKESTIQRFFSEYIPFIRQLSKSVRKQKEQSEQTKEHEIDLKVEKGDCILIDSTGLPNCIRFPLTAVSNHNGKISNEVRLIYVVQQGTGLPIYMRYVPGNVIDASTLVTTMRELKAQKVDTKFAILDAGYVTEANLKELIESKVSFLSRLPDNRTLFKDLVKEYGDELDNEDNLVRYGERLIYLKRFEREIIPGHKGYAYLGLDLAERSMLQKQIARHANADNLSIADVKKQMKNKGIFCLVCSRPIAVENILPLYYTRQDVEQVFDISKNYASMLPLCVESEETFRGHLLMTFLATVVQRLIQLKAHTKQWSLDDLFTILRNQKCKAFSDVIIPQEATKKQNEIYKAFGIKIPKTISATISPVVD